MGVKYLNSFLKKNCGHAIETLTLGQLKNKTVVIDASIYIYKFMETDDLHAHMRHMIETFHENHIKMIFIFDGKPPPEKKQILMARNEIKWQAKEQHDALVLAESTDVQQIHELKCKSLRINEHIVKEIKQICDDLKVNWIQAPQEADTLCIRFVKNKIAYACLTEDMDMFVYGCERILKELDLDKKTVQYYSINKICGALNVSLFNFRQIVILSGTDYNTHVMPIRDGLFHYRNFKKNSGKFTNFYEWLFFYKKTTMKLTHLNKVIDMYQISDNIEA
jgi:5'-3' exonuclease